jgi:hypothetical protein
MTSAKKREEPIEAVKLEISLKTDKLTAGKVKEAFPQARFKGGRCLLTLEGKEPSDVAEQMKVLAEKLRAAERI